jgi:hypothetical protein
MVEKTEFDQLSLRAAVHRERATQARRLASEINDTIAQHGMLQHADEQERRAEELEAQIAVLKEAAQIAEPEQDIAALKLPPQTPARDKPDGTAT